MKILTLLVLALILASLAPAFVSAENSGKISVSVFVKEKYQNNINTNNNLSEYNMTNTTFHNELYNYTLMIKLLYVKYFE